jgi:hypothetical protein
MIAIDRTSLTAEVSGETTLRELEAELARHGLTLGVDGDATIAAWLAEGAPGARDPWRSITSSRASTRGFRTAPRCASARARAARSAPICWDSFSVRAADSAPLRARTCAFT